MGWKVALPVGSNFIVVRYSVTNNDLPSKNRFCCKANVVRTNCMCENMGNAFALIFFMDVV
jgi:hypothetical protein